MNCQRTPLTLFFSFSLLFSLIAGAQGQSRLVPFANLDLDCKNLHVISQGFLHQHILYEAATPELENRTTDQFLKKLDPFKIYLLTSDVEQIRKSFKGVFGQIEQKNCDVFMKAQKLYTQRVEERVKFIKGQLGKGFKYDNKTTLVLDPQERKSPEDMKAAQEYHKKYLQFQISNYLATGDKLEKAKDMVSRNYDRMLKKAKDYKAEELYADYLDSFARSLDPHSSYFSKDVLEDFEIQMRLQLEGIGATLSSQDGFTTVEQLLPGGAAAKSGLVKTQDKIIAVGQVLEGQDLPFDNVVEMDLSDVVRKIRGKKGTQVRLKILRQKGDQPESMVVTLTRDKISLEDEAASLSWIEKDLNGVSRKVAVLNLPSFYQDSRKGGRSAANDLKKLLKDVRAKKADGVVLDLSTNGGGSLEDAVSVAGLFFKTGNVVKQSSRLTTKGGKQATALDDRDEEVDWAGPLVVLTSRVSASASEIVAGTLQDYKRAVIVGGDHTFGKGSIQQVVQLPPGLGAIKVTVGMFFTPGGSSTQHRGVSGDVVLPSALATDEIGEKILDYSLPPQKIDPFLSKEAYVKSGPGAWKEVETTIIDSIKGQSKLRVAQNSDFEKSLQDLKKYEKEKKKAVSLDETFKERKELEHKREEKAGLNKEQKQAEYLKRADVQEAANVVVDLIDSQNKVKLKVAKESKKDAAKEPSL